MSSVDELLETARSETESGLVPASQIAVAREGEIVAFETFGDAMPESRFPIYSATKPIVASAMWLLIGDDASTHSVESSSTSQSSVRTARVSSRSSK